MSDEKLILAYARALPEACNRAWRLLAIQFALVVTVIGPLIIWMQLQALKRTSMEAGNILPSVSFWAMFLGVCVAVASCSLSAKMTVPHPTRRWRVAILALAYGGGHVLLFHVAHWDQELAIWGLALWGVATPAALPLFFIRRRKKTIDR
jgi:hypothetical protein